MKNLFNVKIKDKDNVTIYSCIQRLDKGILWLPYVDKFGKPQQQAVFTCECTWVKCNNSYIGTPKLRNNGKHLVVTPVTTMYSVYLECHEDNGQPYPLLGSFATKKQAENYIESMQEPHKFYAFIEKETNKEVR